MQIEALKIPDVLLIKPVIFGDDRGWFMETFRQDALENAGVKGTFCQDNQSFSAGKGTVRGLHFQLEPFAQGKLVRALSGAILDVAVDLRKSSPTFGQYVAARLDAKAGHQLWVPPGFAHGFCTLEPDTMVVYKVTNYYSREHDRSLAWNDPELAIEWPVGADEAILSDKDKVAPRLADLGPAFE